MSVLDVERLLEAVSGDDPCGPALDSDAAFLAMERASQGKAEQQFGETVIQAEPPDWREVRKQSTALLSRTKDVRVAVFLSQAALQTDGFAGFADGLDVVYGLLERYWDGVHPRLDPEDNDPTWRVNALLSLSGDVVVQGIRRSPLVALPGLGRFSLRDIEVAQGKVAAPSGEEPPKTTAIDGAFSAAPRPEIEAAAAAVDRALATAGALDDLLGEKVGASQAPDLGMLARSLRDVQAVFAARLGRAGGEPGAAAEGAPGGAGPARPGEIASREDVIRLLDKACEYFERYEPSSPVPLLLRRAKRLVAKSFLEIVRDLVPDAMPQVDAIRGPQEGE
jgi:type VI secretion system protein ImpA